MARGQGADNAGTDCGNGKVWKYFHKARLIAGPNINALHATYTLIASEGEERCSSKTESVVASLQDNAPRQRPRVTD